MWKFWDSVGSQARDGVRTTSLGPRNLLQATGSATLIEGFDSASYGRTSIGALCPITSMAPVLAITGMVAGTATSFDPVGEIN